MQALPHELTGLSLVFAPLFSKGVWSAVQVLLAGAILAIGPRTVSAALRVMGLSEEEQFQKYHRVLNRATWSTIAASRKLLLILIDAFIPEGPLVMVLDDTIERRRGAKIAARGIYRDPARSSRSHFVKTGGLRWLCLMLLAPIPWANRSWAWPFCTVLAPSERYYLERGREPNKLTDRAIARTTPVILALYSLVTLFAKHLLEQETMPIHTAAWYEKDCATFSDTLAVVAPGSGTRSIYQCLRKRRIPLKSRASSFSD